MPQDTVLGPSVFYNYCSMVLCTLELPIVGTFNGGPRIVSYGTPQGMILWPPAFYGSLRSTYITVLHIGLSYRIYNMNL